MSLTSYQLLLPRDVCGEGWNRTTGTRRFKPLLYLLSYRTIICSLVVDTHSRFTILCQQVNALYEFPVSYNHNIFISTNFFFLHGSRTPTSHFLPPFSVLQRYIIFFNLPNFFKLFFSVVRVGLEPTSLKGQQGLNLSCIPIPPPNHFIHHYYVKEPLLLYKVTKNF